MVAIERLIEAEGWSQQEAARHFGVSQPRISEICQGKIWAINNNPEDHRREPVGERVSSRRLE
ncbi:MAG: XRE family transcriptional regulator [Deltaproteobacteria bacterium]|nr:XRE family transcriptional regulator [Deltaproteobacteria bacterium]